MKLFGSKPDLVKRSVSLHKGTGPAVPRTVVEAKGGIDMAKRFDKAGTALQKRDLFGLKAQVYMLLDHSGSMRYDYEHGTVQEIVSRALGVALQVDVDGTIPVIRFDDRLYKPVNVTLDNFQDIARTKLYESYKMSGTLMAPPLRHILDIAKTTNDPMIVIVVGDGQPEDKAETQRLVMALSAYPVFLKFLAIRDIPFLRKLDDMEGRVVDNADAQFITDVDALTPLQFADAMTEELDTWVAAAQQAGILVGA